MDTISKILLLMKHKGIEQRQLADFLGINKSAITEWKAGRSHSYRKYIDKIADYFEVSVDYLLNDEALPQVTKEKPLQNTEAVFKLYNALYDYGIIKPNEELTDERIKQLLEFISVNRRFLEQAPKNSD